MIKQKLKDALKLAGLKEGLADVITITDESQIAGIVAQLKAGGNTTEDPEQISPEDFLQSEAMTNFLKEKGFDELLKLNKSLQSEHDKKMNQGLTTFKKKILGGGTDPNDPPKPPTTPSEAPEWFKPFADTLQNIAKEKEVSTKSDLAKTALSKANIPEALRSSWINRIQLESETPFEEQVKALEDEYKTIHSTIVSDGTYEFQPTERKLSGSETSKKELDELKAMANDL